MSKRIGNHRNLQDLFARSKRAENNCIEWQNAKNAKGYGSIKINKKMVRVPRLVCELIYGPPLENQLALHSCDNPPCINPDHLRWGTAQENQIEKFAKGRNNKIFPRGEQSARSKLTEDAVKDIRYLASIKTPQAIIMAKHGISKPTIQAIRSRKSWGWLE